MSATEIWIVIVGMTIVTAVTRALFLIGGERTVLPERAQRALRYAPAAALVAVVLPDVLETPAGLSFALSNHPFYAALAGLGWFCGGAACSVRSSSECSSSPRCA